MKKRAVFSLYLGNEAYFNCNIVFWLHNLHLHLEHINVNLDSI